MGRKSNSLIGKKFGFLSVIGQDKSHNSCTAKYWTCECECGNIIVVKGSSLTLKRVSDCGCKSCDIFTKVRRNGSLQSKSKSIKQQCSITKLNDDGCVNLLEAFLSYLTEDYYSAYCNYKDNPNDSKANISYRKLTNFILSDYFHALTGLDGKAIINGLNMVNERRYKEGIKVGTASA